MHEILAGLTFCAFIDVAAFIGQHGRPGVNLDAHRPGVQHLTTRLEFSP